MKLKIRDDGVWIECKCNAAVYIVPEGPSVCAYCQTTYPPLARTAAEAERAMQLYGGAITRPKR